METLAKNQCRAGEKGKLTRRRFLRYACIAGAAISASTLASACGKTPAPATSGPAPTKAEAVATTAVSATPVPPTAAPSQAPEAILRICYGAEVETLDKPSSGMGDVSLITQQLFANLVRTSPEGKIVGDFAESWDLSADGLVYTFHLRKGAKWSDGSRTITATDVKYSWDRYFWPETKSPFPGWGLEDVVGYQDIKDGKTRDLAGAKVLDDFTFQVTLTQPSGIFLNLIAYPTLNIVQKENAEQGTEGKPWWKTPVCSGPFMVESWTEGQELVLVPNPNYYGTKPSVSKVVYKFIPDASARTLAYENGDLDIIVPSEADIKAATEQGKFQGELLRDAVIAVQFIAIKVSAEPTDDVHVRRALALAIDRDLIAKSVLKGVYEPAHGWEPASTPWHNPNQDYLAFDPARAKEEASQAQYGEPATWPKITMLVSGGATGTGSGNRMAAAMQAMWKENLGIDVEIKDVENPHAASMNKEGQMLYWGVGNGIYDPHYVMDACAMCSGWNNAWLTGFEKEGGGYTGGYCNEQLDELITAAKGEIDSARRIKMYQEAEQTFLLDSPMIPLYIANGFFLVKPYVKNIHLLNVWEIHLETVTIEK